MRFISIFPIRRICAPSDLQRVDRCRRHLVDGFRTAENRLTVSIIPHTAKETVLGFKTVGDIVNLEFDLIGKYLYSFLQTKKKRNRRRHYRRILKETGFI